MIDTTGRHPAVIALAAHFEPNAQLPAPLLAISRQCHDLAAAMIDTIPDDPQLTRGLDALLTAKDRFVRAGRATLDT